MINIAEHWATLVSIIIGLGIADLLVNLHRLIHARKRVDWDVLPLVWAAVALLWLFNYWWAVGAGLDGSRGVRVVGHFVLLAIAPILLFLLSASVLPRALPLEGRLDMRAEWSQNRDVFFAVLALNQAVTWAIAIAARGAVTWDFAGIVRTVVLVLAVTTLFARSRRLEWFAAVFILGAAVARLSTQAVQ